MKQLSSPPIIQLHQTEQGFTLVEVLVALVMLLATLGGLVPLLLSFQITAINDQIRTGALAVAQQSLDNIRQTQWDLLPAAGAVDIEETTVNFSGRDYLSRATFCPNAPNDSALLNQCDEDTRAVRVEVLSDNREIIEIETVYTRFD